MTRSTALLPAARMFSCELANISSVSDAPSGIFLAGALTDKSDSSLRISDPTGVFSVKISRQNAAAAKAAQALEVPCFVAVYAAVRAQNYAGKIFCELTAGSVTQTTRDARDTWICEAAKGAGARLASHPQKTAMLAQIANALNAVKPPAPKAEISDEQIFALIEELSEKKGAPIQKVLDALQKLGLSETEAKARLNQLAEDGDLYSPTKETIKVL
ncbi:MAG TPA: hypothetical protein O0X70_00830 [Methanocorpusculum sp.]|nr:hypothetical protein [Methanocorpusculum sp.]